MTFGFSGGLEERLMQVDSMISFIERTSTDIESMTPNLNSLKSYKQQLEGELAEFRTTA